MVIKAIFFDAAGTLFHVDGSVGEVYASLARKHGKNVTAKALEEGFLRAFADAPPMAFPSVAPRNLPASERRWWFELVGEIFASHGSFPQFELYFEELYELFSKAKAWKLYPETYETLFSLKEMNLHLGIISNFDSRLFPVLEGLAIREFFESVVASTSAGVAKPDKKIFEKALAIHEIDPGEALHVGDSYEMDVIGAHNAGVGPVLIDRSRDEKHDDVEHTIISRLDELIDLCRRD